MNAFEMIHDAIEHGGGTYEVRGGWWSELSFTRTDHIDGYYVSEPKGIENLPSLNKDVVEEFIIQKIITGSGLYLGLWFDGQNWSVDQTRWFSSKPGAAHYCKLNNQRAFWDIANSEELFPIGVS